MKTRKTIKYLIVFVISFYTVTFFSQNNSGTVLYSKTIYIPKLNKLSKTHKEKTEDFKKRIQEVSNKLEYVLKFNNEESQFELSKHLNFDKNELFVKTATTTAGGNGTYYTNIKTNEFIHQTTIGGQKFLIKEKLDSVKWTLVNETKMIGKYLCYKATTMKKIYRKVNTTVKMIAWYCPKLPNYFGPIGYGGLPGLILELKSENTGAGFTAKKITINSNEEIIITKPTKGKIVNEAEFQESCKKMYYRRKQG